MVQSPAAKQAPTYLKNVALFFAAPFIGLVYAMSLPFVGISILAWSAGKAMMANPKGRKVLPALATAGKLVAAPFIGLANAVVMPFVGVAMLLGLGAKALFIPPEQLKRDRTRPGSFTAPPVKRGRFFIGLAPARQTRPPPTPPHCCG